MKPLVIYHNNCADGFGAAWCFHHAANLERAGGRNHQGFDFFGATHGTGLPPPDLYVNRSGVYVVDFCFNAQDLATLCNSANLVMVLDHHKTAQETVHGFARDNFNHIFDMGRAGAMICWDLLCPGIPAPQLLHHIQDRDLWRFALDGTKEIQQALFSYEYDFDVWTKLMLETPIEQLRMEGEALLRKHLKDINEFIAAGHVRYITFDGYDNIPLINVPYTMGSDTCHILAEDAPFAMYYYDTADKRYYGLRSREDGADVGAIAKKYGGGGHKHASGFSVSLNSGDVRLGV